MRKRLALLTLAAFALIGSAASVSLAISSAEPDPVYSAGNKREGTSICRCPVLVGDCVCEISAD